MAGLCDALLQHPRLRNVSTYIQSGNVLFESDAKDPAMLAGVIEAAVRLRFRIDCMVLIVSAAQWGRIVRRAPDGFGADPDTYRYDVVFLKPPASAREVLASMDLKEGVDQA